MKIGIIGATGKAGQKLTQEAIKRGLDVTAIVRDPSKLTESVQVINKNILELTKEDIKPFDVIINTFAAPLTDAEQYRVMGKHLITIFNDVKTRLMVVGGAGRLFVDETSTTHLFETPEFPEFLIPSSKNQYESYLELKASSIKWTYVSPAAFFDPEGKRTCNYEVGKDHLIFNSLGESYISYADLAVAIIDEAVSEKHLCTAITVVGEK
ncbi:NAD(P)H-binding protein [Solibacillus sp. FSL K6-1781]|uniref:NAD(P)-dependent oxidoreductase n=1 Tax=Solibacillus sp. FSL K6-1781 TaxID=2921474 RepID=UPI00315B0348